jgi:hypothetical protein
MLYLFKLLLILINIDQETVLNWFGVDDPNVSDFTTIKRTWISDIDTSTY